MSGGQNQISQTQAKPSSSSPNNAISCGQHHHQIGGNNNPPSNVISCSSIAFQQIKQTQASLARLSRHVHQTTSSHQGQTNNSSQQHNSRQQQQQNQSHQQQAQGPSSLVMSTSQIKSNTFVDCLIRRFKDCFSEDFCTVPMFVVGNLSPGSDGNHLILPPCVSLCGQNISRFASSKNLRLMNSIRESCKSIEELDLGGNKLTDLIEIYKILQCTPNLKFLNLSENDLSKAAPVALAANSSVPIASGNQNHWPSSSFSAGSSSSSGVSRTFLGPLSQNQQTSMCSRRHSTLGTQTAGINSAPHLSSRGTEARRLATATAAVAQSKKTSSSIVSKLSDHVSIKGSRLCTKSGPLQSSSPTTNLGGRPSKTPARAASTMNLARSLSSLSAKNSRTLSGFCRKNSDLKDSSIRVRQQQKSQDRLGGQQASKGDRPTVHHQSVKQSRNRLSDSGCKTNLNLKQYPEPISETEQDIDMIEQANNLGQHQLNCASAASVGQSHLAAGNNVTKQQTGMNQFRTSLSNVSSHQHQNLPFRRFTFESIKALALNNTGCQWRIVCSIVSRIPNLEELHLSLNNYERIDLDPNQDFRHNSLRRLYLCNNPKLTDWQELTKLLIAFPSLEALSIADCNISQIPENLSQAREWRKLCGLNINGWPIKEWPVIERLNQLPSLIDLKCRNLELLSSIDEPREHLIARLPRLQRLNGSEIEERDQAEKVFLRFFVTNSHLERPSRYHELVQIHGFVDAQVDIDVDLSPPSRAHIRVVYLNRSFYRDRNQDDILMSEDFLNRLMDNIDTTELVQQQNDQTADDSLDSNIAACPTTRDEDDCKLVRLFKDEGQEVVSIEVDLRQSVRKFKQTLASLFGLSSQNMILYYIDREMVSLMGPELIKHNQKKLWNYNVQDGDQFIVEER